MRLRTGGNSVESDLSKSPHSSIDEESCDWRELWLDRFELIHQCVAEKSYDFHNRGIDATIQILQYANSAQNDKTLCSLGVSKIVVEGINRWEMMFSVKAEDSRDLSNGITALLYAIGYVIDNRLSPTLGLTLPLLDTIHVGRKYQKQYAYIGLLSSEQKPLTKIRCGAEVADIVRLALINKDEYFYAQTHGTAALERKWNENGTKIDDISRNSCL